MLAPSNDYQMDGGIEMAWIKVSEKLPDKNITVLVYTDKFKSLSIALAQLNDSGNFILNDSGLILREITHWMPLPEPPKED